MYASHYITIHYVGYRQYEKDYTLYIVSLTPGEVVGVGLYFPLDFQ